MKEDLKVILESLVADLVSQGVDLQATPALFTWRYPDNEVYKYQLLIAKSAPAADNGGDSYVH